MNKLIPPLLFLICFVSMIGLTMALPQLSFIPTPWNYLGFFLMILGLSFVRKIQQLFKTENTEIHTFKTPKKLITIDLFRFSRNPIYLGFFLALLGWAIVLGNAAAFDGAFLFFVIAHFWYIPFEENKMETEFGQDYLDYKRKVRRWF